MPYHHVVELLDGRYMKFLISPSRKIMEEDLTALPHYIAAGKKGEEAAPYMYKLYGLEKA